MELLPSLFTESGGLRYHASALRHRLRDWRPFTAAVEHWLDQWNTNTDTLLLFGPSGGWTLNESFLSRFRSVICIEPDPVARWLLTRRFAKTTRLKLESRADLLPWTSNTGFEGILGQYPSAAVLFSNLLGQLPLISPSNYEATQIRAKFFAALSDRSWASYHDVLSVDGRLRNDAGPLPYGKYDIEQLARHFFSLDKSVVLRDHDTSWLGATDFAGWQLRAKEAHVVGFVKQESFANGPLNTKNPSRR